MDAAMTDPTADARNVMVDGQLRPNRVTDRRILDVMRRLRREAFVPADQRARAYADAEVPLGHGRVLLSPMVVGRLIQAAEAKAGSAVLTIGAGYAAAVFAGMGMRVTALEQDQAILDLARAGVAASMVDVTFVTGPLPSGWAEGAPYDVIFVDGAVPSLPRLEAQLRADPPGRLCAVVCGPDPSGRFGLATLGEPAGSGLAQRILFDCAATPMPQFRRAETFRF
jgi:protein-L-isoaspartate(D-aspartate) O-methyltransferase